MLPLPLTYCPDATRCRTCGGKKTFPPNVTLKKKIFVTFNA